MKDKVILFSLLMLTALCIVGTLTIVANEVEAEDLANIPNNGIVFIWNDDEESIPPDGSLIQIEQTDENTVYIGTSKLDLPEEFNQITEEDTLRGYFDSDHVFHLEFNNKRNH